MGSLMDGKAVQSCQVTLEEMAGRQIQTIEGLAHEDKLHPVQEAFVHENAMQCGYCTSGMVMSAAALLERIPHPSEDDIRAALDMHLCRCGVYGRAIRAVKRAAEVGR